MYTKNYSAAGEQWLLGKVVSVTGPVSVIVELTNGTRVRRYFDQIRKYQGVAVTQDNEAESFEMESGVSA